MQPPIDGIDALVDLWMPQQWDHGEKAWIDVGEPVEHAVAFAATRERRRAGERVRIIPFDTWTEG